MDKVVDSVLYVIGIESIGKEKQRLLTMLKNKEISTVEYIEQIEKLN